jgi:CubicO group peptidase (beta-lactamase class C family)/pimeloyl-ACP methyl ester carboxylesterase
MDIRHTVPRAILAIAVIVVSAAALGAGYERVSAARDEAAYPPPGRLVDIGGYRLHISCMGEGSPTVIFESGLANLSADWTMVQPQVASTSRACAYDRAGIGWSNDGRQPRDPRRIAHELHALLIKAGVSAPYVLVGQSFGGLYVRVFADLYTDEVAGIVLVDASHPDMWARAPAGLTAVMVPSAGASVAYRALAHLGLLRLTSTFPAECGLSAQHCDEERAWAGSARRTDAFLAEMGAADRDAQVRDTRPLGALPLLVLTATNHTADFGPYAREVDPLWQQMQVELAALSSNSSHYVVEGATHSSLQLHDASVTSTAIGQVVQSIREGQPLTPPLRQLTSTREPDFAAIDRFVDSERQAMRVPGLAIGVVHGDRIMHLAGFGQADGNGRPVTQQTLFLTASLAKSFTALAVMQLVEAGRVDLDAPIQRYLPWFRVADADASARITVRHLLNQTSGFPTLPANAGMVGGGMDDQAIERGVRSLAGTSLSQPVGATYQYSNWNYWTLGALVQSVSGESYEAYLQQHVLEPLAMRRTYTSQAAARAESLTTGHRFWFGIPLAFDLTYSRSFVPSGGLISTSEDLAHYLIAQLNGGQYAGTSVLSAAGIGEQHRGAVRTGDGDDSYGMGWVSGVVDDRPIIHHNGTLPTGYGDLRLLPEDGWGIVVLSNANSHVALPRLDGLALGIASMLAGQQPRAATESRPFEAITIAAMAVCVLQLVLMLRFVPRLRRWQLQPQSRPRGVRSLAWHVGVPLVLNVAWAALLVVVVPSVVGLSFGDIVFLFGDLGYLLAFSAGAALVWGIVRAALALCALHTDGRAYASTS